MQKLSRGTFAILVMVVVALGLSIFAAWFRYQAGDAALKFWGRDAALRIRNAPQALLIVLEAKDDADAEKSHEIGGARYVESKMIDLSSARGLIHARHALLEDESLDFAAQPPSPPPTWDRLLRFVAQDGGETEMAIDLETGWLRRTDTGALLKLKEPQRSLVAYLKKFTDPPLEQ